MSNPRSRADIDELVDSLTLEEQVALLAGADSWHTVPIERAGIPAMRVSDGPSGARGTRSRLCRRRHHRSTSVR